MGNTYSGSFPLQLEDNATQRPVIDAEGVVPATIYVPPRIIRHLGGSVRPGSTHFTAIVSEAIDRFSLRFNICAAKVTDAGVESKIDKDIFWLQISVNDPSVMDGSKTRCLKVIAKNEDGR